ncbi:MAG: glutamine amidotransferase [Pseudomonadota bacterium]
MTGVAFALPPSSPAGLAVIGAGVFLLVLSAVRFYRLGLRGRLAPLLGVRLLATGALVLLILGPETRSERRVDAPLAAGNVTPRIPPVEGRRLDGYLPPATRWSPVAPPSADRVRIRSAAPPLLALFKNRDRVRVELFADLQGPRRVELVLYDLSGTGGRKELRRRAASLEAGRADLAVELPFVPDRLGEMLLGVRLVCPSGVECEDDGAVVQVQVVRESLRILHVAGHPSWDLRFLREHLKGRPSYEVVSFYVLANQENFQPLPPDEVALIPFPTDELFLEELPGFDLLVIQDFPLGSYFLLRKEHLESIASFVRDGGGLLMLGGGAAFSRGGVRGTPVAEILPVDLPPPPTYRADGDGEPDEFRPVLTAQGVAHPLMRLGLPELPTLTGWNELGTPRAGARTLLTAPGNAPLLVVGDAGAGRVAVLGTDSLWSWAFPEGSGTASIRGYEALMDHLVQWLTRDPAFDALRIRPAEEPGRAGEALPVRLCIQGAAEAAGLPLHWGGRWSGLEAASPGDAAGEARTGDDGCATVSLPAVGAGAWQVTATGVLDGRAVGGEALLPVHPDRRTEAARRGARVRAALPQPFMPLLPPPPVIRRVLPDTVPLTWTVSEPLWHNPVVLLLVVFLLALDWTLRRRFGML